jgi:hypothetical protein
MIRKGDLVSYFPLGKNRRRLGIVLGTEKAWYCIKGHISIDGQIVPLNQKRRKFTFGYSRRRVVRLVKKREDLKNWWEYLDKGVE